MLLLDSEELNAATFPVDMSNWAIPLFDRKAVDAAGRTLVTPNAPWGDLEHAYGVINNWRSSHSFPLNTFQVSLRHKAKQVDASSFVAQRIKRLSSILHKLDRFSSMRLSRMQDIGGCRAIVGTVEAVGELHRAYMRSQMKHKLDRTDDYILEPKLSGYRGIHLVYKYYSDYKQTYNGLKIEMQLRSQLQHAWATAVETVGTFIHQALKSSQGEEQWLRFFALMGTAIALREGTPPVPGTPAIQKDLVKELKTHVRRLNVERRLGTYGATLRTLEAASSRNAHYFLLKLDPVADSVTITGFEARDLEKASAQYLATERAISGISGAEAVLVSVESLAALRRAYPNYFLDTRAFIDAVKYAIA